MPTRQFRDDRDEGGGLGWLSGGFIGLAVLAVFLLITGFLTYFTTANYEVTAVTRWGKLVRIEAPGSGLHFKVPFIEGTVNYPITIQSMTLDKLNTYTVDNQELDARMVIQYRMPPSSVSCIYSNLPDYRSRIAQVAIDRFKSELGKVNVTDVASSRGVVVQKVRDVIRQQVKDLYCGIQVVDVQLPDIQYTQSFRQANDRAATMKAQVDQAEQEQRKIKVNAETARIEALGAANAVREKAKGDADARLYNAQAEAKAIQLKGEAEAASIKAQTDALKQGSTVLVQLEQARRWDGKLPQQILGSAPLPIFNIGK